MIKGTIEKIRRNEDLLEKYGSPLYVYDYDVLKERCQQMSDFQNSLEEKLGKVKVNLHYSTKANNNPTILKLVKETGLCVDCMSPLELHINQRCGFQANQILYVCNNIESEEMKIVHDANVLICLDSISQVETWGKLFPNTEIMVRINPGLKGIGHNEKVITSGKTTKFGITEVNFPELFQVVEKYHLKIIGTHQHLGSLFLNDKIEDYLAGVKSGLNIIKNNFPDLRIIDLGGGFGVPYTSQEEPLNLNVLKERLEEILVPFIQEYPSVQEFKFEPGRFIPCEASILMGRVTATKYENETWWVGTDVGMNQLVRPSMYNAYHEVSFLYPRASQKIIANICGNICESCDIIAKEREVNLPNVEDIVLVHNAGAYGYSMASNYTGRLRPAEVLLKDNQVSLIRKRETIEDLEKNMIWE